ncbi:MAG: hypothetical protein M3N93_05405, partial [Acidobacteriota bacterium]|nr:hypothetical protein [Acidobacteriota bacterium]
LMIGSFGTLAAIVSVNFKLTPRPALARTLLFAFDDLKSALEARSAAIRGVLNPVAVDLLNPVFSAQVGMKGFVLAVMFAGNQSAVERSLREASAFGPSRALSIEDEQRFWDNLHASTPRFLEKFHDTAAVVRISTTLSECGDALQIIEGPGHAHAASGIVRGWFTRPESAARCMAEAVRRGWKAVIEFSSESLRSDLALWPEPGRDLAIMKEIKKMFDPGNLLNRGRLFGQL